MERGGAMTDMYDQALLGILQHVGNVQEFLNILFGFLYRKTDFYRLLLQPGDRLGFPPGVAKSMTVRAFRNFEDLARHDDERRQLELDEKLKKRKEEAAAAAERKKLPVVAEEVEISSVAEQDCASSDGKTAEASESATVSERVEAEAASPAATPPAAACAVEAQPAEPPKHAFLPSFYIRNVVIWKLFQKKRRWSNFRRCNYILFLPSWYRGNKVAS